MSDQISVASRAGASIVRVIMYFEHVQGHTMISVATFRANEIKDKLLPAVVATWQKSPQCSSMYFVMAVDTSARVVATRKMLSAFLYRRANALASYVTGDGREIDEDLEKAVGEQKVNSDRAERLSSAVRGASGAGDA